MSIECYYCEKIGNTVEHVPPKCLFPKVEDFGVDYRKNLITVKSCEQHNCEKSGHDETLRQMLVASPLNNSIGQGLVSGKWKRAFERNPKALEKFLAGGSRISYQLNENEPYQEGLMVKRNLSDLDESLKRISAALFYHETNRKLKGEASLFTGFTLYLNEETQRASEKAIEMARNYFSEKPKIGENPEIFYYNFDYSEHTAMFYLVFYGYNEALVRFKCK